MANNINVLDATGVSKTLRTSEVSGVHTPIHQILGYDEVGEKLLIGTARERFFENFFNFDTSATGNWELISTGSGMTITGPTGGAAAGSSPYLNIASGTTAGQKTIILSRSTFSMPLDLRYQISASQRIANNRLLIGFVEVDPTTGAVLTSSTYTTVNDVLNARNAVVHSHEGTVATTANLFTRVAGSALDTQANAFGTGFTTVATGTTPNFIPATIFGFSMERDRILSRAWGQSVLTNTGAQFAYDRLIVNPTKYYKLCIIVENQASAPASNTDWRIHMINVMDATRLDVSPRNSGTSDQSKAFPVFGNVTLLGGTTAVTTAAGGINVAPVTAATTYFLNSAATTNANLVLTGSSGLTAFWASNTGATPAFVKLYNKATAPVVGTDVPEMIIPLEAAPAGSASVRDIAMGFNSLRFPLGLGIAITGGVADSDTTAVAAGQVKVKLSRTV